jgi:hypothetical protein
MEDYLMLTGQEKKQIVRNQLKNLQYSKYIAQLNYDVESTNPEIFSELLISLESEVEKISAKEAFLISKLEQLNIEYPEN